ncbi:MAG: hypothetical protein ACYTFW_05105 [Planctomycetota bacterium]|jgi:hypothetical protein
MEEKKKVEKIRSMEIHPFGYRLIVVPGRLPMVKKPGEDRILTLVGIQPGWAALVR